MKNLFLFVFLFSLIKVNAQFPTKIFTPLNYDRVKMDRVFIPPYGTDTPHLTINDIGSIFIMDTVQYRWNGTKWTKLAGGGGSGETINNGLFLVKTGSTLLVDSAALSQKYIRRTDTTKIPVGEGLGVSADTILNTRPFVVINSAVQMRTSSEVKDVNTVYRMMRNGFLLDYTIDATDNVSADDSVTVIINNGKRLKLNYGAQIIANWFGMIPDDNLDDSYPLQKAINYAIRTQKTPFVKVLGGSYNVNNVMIYSNTAGEYNFVNLTLEGVSQNHSPGSVAGGGTSFKNTNTSGFTIGMQLARHVQINNIAFEGVISNVPNSPSLIAYTDANWTNNGAIRNNRYSPYSHIAIDPFYYTVAEANRYPGMSSWYTNGQFQGSSMVTIEGCDLRNSLVGILISPNGVTQNGDNIVFRNGSQLNNRTFWASCQTQTRGNIIENLYSVGNTGWLINCKEYGYQQGTPPMVTNCNIAGGVKYLYWYDAAFGGVSFNQCYMESVWSLGKSGDLPATFINTEISLMSPDDGAAGARRSPIIAQGNRVIWKGGDLQIFDNENADGFNFDVQDLDLDGVLISGIPIISGTYRKDRINFNNFRFKHVTGSATLSDNGRSSNIPVAIFNGNAVVPGMKYQTEFFGVDYEIKGRKYDRLLMETQTLRVNNTAEGKGYFISSNSQRWQAGDLITTDGQNIDYNNDMYAGADGVLGYVYAKSGDTVKIRNIPHGVNDNVSYNLWFIRIPKFQGRTLGTLSVGNNVISNVFNNGANETFHIGDYIKGTGVPVGARVAAITSNSITLTMNATASGTNVQLYDAVAKATANNLPIDGNGASALQYELPFFAGDEWKNERNGTIDAYGGYIATAGWINASGGRPATGFGLIKQQDNTGLVTLSGTNYYTGLNEYRNSLTRFGQDQYAGTVLEVIQNGTTNGYMTVQTYGSGINGYGGKGVYGGEGDYGTLKMNPGGGNVIFGESSTYGKVSIAGAPEDNYRFKVHGNSKYTAQVESEGIFFSTGVNGIGTAGKKYASLYWYPANNIGTVNAYDPTANQYLNFSVEGKRIFLAPSGDTTKGLVIANNGDAQFKNDLTANGNINSGATISAINGNYSGGIINGQTDVNSYSWYAPGGGKFYQLGRANFGRTVFIDSLAGGGNTVANIDNDGRLIRGGANIGSIGLISPISSGSSSTGTFLAGGVWVIFTGSGTYASYSYTMPATPNTGTQVDISFVQAVTSLSINPNSGQTLTQTSIPTSAAVGDFISYRYYSGTWVRIK